MKTLLITFFILYNISFANANDLKIYIDSALKNNPRLNAERKNLEATKENINISKSEFLPTLSISGNIDSVDSKNRTNQSGATLADTNNQTETKKISVDQKIFQGFKGYNSLKKSQLEVERDKFELRNIEQQIILESATVFFDLNFKTKNKKFNISNVSLFERQVESDGARLQKGQITLTDLAQSESSLAGAQAKLISSKTELITAETKFKRITTMTAPTIIKNQINLKINVPQTLNEALLLAEKNNPKLMIAKLNHKISSAELNIEKANLSPSASVNYSKSENSDFSSTVNKIDQESLKATVTWPIINGKNYSTMRKAKFNKEKTNLLLEDVISQINTETTNTWSIFKSSVSVLEATKAQLKAAEIANEGITLEYDSGNKRTTLEVIQSRTLLLEARKAQAKAERDYVISKFTLLSQLGILNLNNLQI